MEILNQNLVIILMMVKNMYGAKLIETLSNVLFLVLQIENVAEVVRTIAGYLIQLSAEQSNLITLKIHSDGKYYLKH